MANPPFRGDRELREFIGKEAVEYLKNRFTDGAVVDYATFFLLRYDQIVGVRAVIATLGTNTLAQGKNRRIGLQSLVSDRTPPYSIFRAVRNRPWPGEAAVFVCVTHLVHKGVRGVPKPRLINPEFGDDGKPLRDIVVATASISSFLDDLPEIEVAELPSVLDGMAYQGMQPLGPFECDDAFVKTVPRSERTSVRAYLNNDDIQQQIEPLARRSVIDVYDALKDEGKLDKSSAEQLRWLRQRFPVLVSEIERQRREGAASSNAEHWWLFHRTRDDLREAWHGLQRVIVFGRVGKVYTPTIIPMEDPHSRLRNLFPRTSFSLHRAIHGDI